MPDDPFGDAFGPLGPLVGRLLGDLGSLDLGDLRPPPGTRGTHGLNRFGRDLTADGRAGLLDPVIGRDDEIDQVIEVLARRTKNNPVLLGDPGVGKTAIVERWTSRAWSRAPSTAASSRSGSPG
jgi:ATP-dependent Clp protease ATP-binding subunit ClpC